MIIIELDDDEMGLSSRCINATYIWEFSHVTATIFLYPQDHIAGYRG